jgi:hypothetical protein
MDLLPNSWSGPTEFMLLVAKFVGLVEVIICTESGFATLIFVSAAVIIIATALRSELDFHRVFHRTPLNK